MDVSVAVTRINAVERTHDGSVRVVGSVPKNARAAPKYLYFQADASKDPSNATPAPPPASPAQLASLPPYLRGPPARGHAMEAAARRPASDTGRLIPRDVRCAHQARGHFR